MSFDSILVAVDFSAGSISAVERALSLANANSRVTLVHVVPSIPLASVSRYSYDLSEPEYQRLLARDAWRRLQDIISTEARTGRTIHARVVAGDPSREIARVATDVDADLILVGVTSRGAIKRLMLRVDGGSRDSDRCPSSTGDTGTRGPHNGSASRNGPARHRGMTRRFDAAITNRHLQAPRS